MLQDKYKSYNITCQSEEVKRRNKKLKPDSKINIMDVITKNPGFQHISEDISKLLDKKSLMNCRSVNSYWKNVLNHPMFWLKKFNSQDMPWDVQRSWKTLVEELDDDQVANELVLIMTKVYNGKKISTTFEVIVKLAEAEIYA